MNVSLNWSNSASVTWDSHLLRPPLLEGFTKVKRDFHWCLDRTLPLKQIRRAPNQLTESKSCDCHLDGELRCERNGSITITITIVPITIIPITIVPITIEPIPLPLNRYNSYQKRYQHLDEELTHYHHHGTIIIVIKKVYIGTLTENLDVRGMAAEQVLQPRHCLQAVVCNKMF